MMEYRYFPVSDSIEALNKLAKDGWAVKLIVTPMASIEHILLEREVQEPEYYCRYCGKPDCLDNHDGNTPFESWKKANRVRLSQSPPLSPQGGGG